MTKLPSITLVTGGAASGKSSFAEALVTSAELACVYLATARVKDAEMAAKVAAHIDARGDGWRSVDASADLSAALEGLQPGEVALLDCATMWLTNEMMAGRDLAAVAGDLADLLSDLPCPVVVVTNEIGHGIVPADALSRAYREAHGKMNQALARRADWVFGVMSGLPFSLKGPDPRELL